MKNALLAISTLMLMSTAVKAETFKCVFTEPFFTINYDTTTQLMKIDAAVEEANQVIKGVQFQVKQDGQFVLKDKKGKTLLTMTLDNQGSDGMSDFTYPYSAIANGFYGGCESSALKKKEL